MTSYGSAIKEVVVVGAGLGGLRTVESLRSEDYEGRIHLVSGETHLPYDRPPLSKGLLTDPDLSETTYHSQDYYDGLDIELHLGSRATRLDVGARKVVLDNDTLPYDAVVLATGAAPVRLPFVPDDMAGVHVLRTLDDALALRDALSTAAHIVIVGAGFIGSEVASSAVKLGCDVTMIEAMPTPMDRSLGSTVGAMCGELHHEHGVKLLCGCAVAGLEGSERVEAVKLTGGEVIDADLVLFALGVRPSVGWLEGAGLDLENGIRCDERLCAGPPDVFAIGDIARWHNPLFGQEMRVEQWTNAAEQGRHVGQNVLRDPADRAEFRGSNFFWSEQYGQLIQFVGMPVGDEVLVLTTAGNDRPLVLYRSGPRAVGVFGIGRARQVMVGKGLIEQAAQWSDAVQQVRDSL